MYYLWQKLLIIDIREEIENFGHSGYKPILNAIMFLINDVELLLIRKRFAIVSYFQESINIIEVFPIMSRAGLTEFYKIKIISVIVDVGLDGLLNLLPNIDPFIANHCFIKDEFTEPAIFGQFGNHETIRK
jgi:hypothetical protein